MREGWTYKKLNEVCDKGSSNIVINKLEDNNGEFPLYGASGLVKNVDFYHQDKPYIGIVKDGAGVGRVNTYPAFSSLVGTMQYIFAKEDCLLDYIKYFLVKLDLSHCVSGATIPHIYFKDYGKERIPVPSLSEQQSIVAELDKINELISLKKAQLSDLDSLAQSIFYDMFGDPIENEKGWEVKKLDSIYKVTSSKRVFQEEWKTEGIPFYKVADIVSLINDEKVIPNTFITEAKYNELKLQSLVPNTGDILVTSRGTLGQCYIVKADDQFYFQDGMITWLSAKKVGISPIYIKMLFKTESFLNSLLQKANISTVAYLSINQLANRFIPIPPLPLQQEFAKRIELIEQQKAQISSTIKDLETLLASRMQYWFD